MHLLLILSLGNMFIETKKKKEVNHVIRTAKSEKKD